MNTKQRTVNNVQALSEKNDVMSAEKFMPPIDTDINPGQHNNRDL